MTLVVQSDNGLVSGANGYADLAFVRTYHSDRGKDTSATSDADLSAAIVRATQYIDVRFVYAGCKRQRDQTTEFPRRDLYDLSGYLERGVPLVVKQAVAELATRSLDAELMPDPERDDSGRTVLQKTEQVGPIKEAFKFAKGGSLTQPEYPLVDKMLAASGFIRPRFTAARA